METSFTVNTVKNNDNRQNNKYIKIGDEKT